MSTGYQAAQAKGTKGECRAGRVRHPVTLDLSLFEALKTFALSNSRSISEEMAARLLASVNKED